MCIFVVMYLNDEYFLMKLSKVGELLLIALTEVKKSFGLKNRVNIIALLLSSSLRWK